MSKANKDNATPVAPAQKGTQEITFLKEHCLDGENVSKGTKRTLPKSYAEFLIAHKIAQ